MTTNPPSPETSAGSLAEMRNALLERLGVTATAWSADGGHFGFVARLEEAPARGSYVRLRLADGSTLLGQIHRREVTQTALAHFEVAGGPKMAAASVPVAVRHAQGDGIVLGRIEGRRLVAAGRQQGFSDALVQPATRGDVAAHRALQRGNGLPMTIGYVASRPEVPAELTPGGFNRHTLLCGQSGSGKTFSTGVILEQLLHKTDLRMVIIDPNSDYVRLDETRSYAEANRTRREPLTRAQYTTLKARHARLARKVKVARASGGNVPLKVRFSQLTLSEQALCLRLDPIIDLAQFNVLRTLAAALGDDYGIDTIQDAARRAGTDDAEQLAIRIENLGVAQWSLWSDTATGSIDHFPADARALVLDTGSLAHERERAVVALSLFGRLQRRAVREPILIVLDEAHNVCPPSSDDPLLGAVIERVTWAAGEGRKYGEYMTLATQRPQKLHPNVVSQCENLILMRINSEGDREHLASLFSHVPSALIEASRDFRLGEALVAGPISPAPMRAIIGGRITPEGGADLPSDWVRGRR